LVRHKKKHDNELKDAIDAKHISGVYPKGTVEVDGDNITLKMHDRPDATGKINGNKGTITFPDHKKFEFEYAEESQTIFFYPRSSGIKWTKECVKKKTIVEENKDNSPLCSMGHSMKF